MPKKIGKRIYHPISRRNFLWLASLSTAGVVTGCAVNPVTGKRQLMLVSQDQEIQVDKENSPHQFSSDYGSLQDQALSDYITQVGNTVVAVSDRPDMPYSFRGVNATYINAYAFPGGSIAATRGILLSLNNEAELSALLGHEIGHVCARHQAEAMTQAIVANVIIAGAEIYMESQHKKYAALAAGLGQIAAGALLARYSRENEREADSLGMKYMTQAGYNPTGMVGLMEVLVGLSKEKPSAIDMMFATHPMSDERYQTAQREIETDYAGMQDLPTNEERYLDSTTSLRQIKEAIEEMQAGEKEMMQESFQKAETHFDTALQQAPDDYAGLVMMSKCQLALERPQKAKEYAQRAKEVYPSEAQAYHVGGVASLMDNDFGTAYDEFAAYEEMLPGNPNTIFLKAAALDGMEETQNAANEYYRYLQAVNQGGQADRARQRLTEWGYAAP